MKQNLVHNGKMQLTEEYNQKAKDLEIAHRVARSTAVSDSRVGKMKARDDLLGNLKEGTLTKLAAFCKSSGYETFVKQLIIEGLIKIEEPVVEVQCRKCDEAIVKKVLASAVSEYHELMTAAGHTPKCSASVCATFLPDDATVGGVVLVAQGFRVMVDNTVEERLQIAYYDQLPKVRSSLFPERLTTMT
jgi:V-type H+-transporting ATPase subunit E